MLRKILKPFSFVPALLLMYMIFSFSAQEGDVSVQLSYKVSVKIVETADYVFDANLDYYQIDHWANKINFITRKLAHMAEYFALAVAVSFPLYVYGMHGILLMLFAGLICVGFACADEYHQSFVLGRSASTKDICIDSVGIFLGIIVVRIIGWTGRKTIFRPKEKKIKNKKKKKNRDYDYEDYENYPDYEPQPGYRQPQGYPPQTGYQPYSGYQQPGYQPQNGYPPYSGYQQAGYQPQNGYPPQAGYQPSTFEDDSYYRPPQPEPARAAQLDPYWQPEKEIDFNLKPEYPEREYMEENDPYDNDWGFDDPIRQPNPQKAEGPTIPQVPPMTQTPPVVTQPAPTPPKPKKKHKKDWFFDL